MQIGLIGAGSIARALARGWRQPIICADPIGARAQELAEEVGGRVAASNREVARSADLVVLCHKPAQLAQVAGEVASDARAVASVLALTPLATVKQAYPRRPVYRFIPSLTAEVRAGAIVQAHDEPQDPLLDGEVRQLFSELGALVVLHDRLLDVAMGLMSCAPAYLALVAEAQVDAGIRLGIDADHGAQLVIETLAGTAQLLKARNYDTLALRRAVCSPGGATARGVDALERAGIRSAFSAALDAAVNGRT